MRRMTKTWAAAVALVTSAALATPAPAMADGQDGYYFTNAYGGNDYGLGDCADANETGPPMGRICFKEAGDHMIVRNRYGAIHEVQSDFYAAAVWKNLATGRKGICAHRMSWDTHSCNYQFAEGANIAFRAATCYVGYDCTNINNYNFDSEWMTRRNDN
jgi:hypothetical protein